MAVSSIQDSRKSQPMHMIKTPALNLKEQLAYDHYRYLKVSEYKKRPDRFYLQTTQQNLTTNHRQELINLLLLLSDDYQFLPETIYSAVGYLDRYLSGNTLEGMQELLLVGLSCFIIAAKQLESCIPSIQLMSETFLYFYEEDNYEVVEFTKEEVLKMEEKVLRFLNYELVVPSPKDFLEIFVDAVISKEMKGEGYYNDIRVSRFRFLTDYIMELYLLDYTMIGFTPSVVASSVVFLAKFIVLPQENPWNSALKNVTEYHAWNLMDCIKRLHSLYYKKYEDVGGLASRKKYSKRAYRFVASMCCPRQIPRGFFY